MTSNAALNTLKVACVTKKFVSFKDLTPGEYIVNKFRIVSTTYGDRIRIDLHDSYMLLPERYVKSLTEKVIEELNKSPKVMTYGGKDACNRNSLILDFNEVSYIANDVFEYITPDYTQQN